MQKIARERVERAARMYRTCQDAGRALDIAPGSFSRLCRLYGIETPHARRYGRSPEHSLVSASPTP
jgi:hypothetical protein